MKNKSYSREEALHKLMNLCSGREMCSTDILHKLQSWGIDSVDHKKILRILSDNNFYSDARFAEAFIHDKLRLQKWGKAKIRYTLKYKGIPEEIIESVLINTDESDYTSRLEDLLKKKLSSIKPTESDTAKRARLYRFAAGRGFESELIFRVLGNLLND